jgi:hypothetical protein
MVDLRPGQLWEWCFTAGADGWWMFTCVTAEGRNSFVASSIVTLVRGEVFTVVSLDDPGPMQLPELSIGIPEAYYDPPKRWHVALKGDKLFWIDHAYFDQAKLLRDVR